MDGSRLSPERWDGSTPFVVLDLVQHHPAILGLQLLTDLAVSSFGSGRIRAYSDDSLPCEATPSSRLARPIGTRAASGVDSLETLQVIMAMWFTRD